MSDDVDLIADMSIVVVDDSRNFLKLVTSILRNFGIKDCISFDDPTQVIDYLEINTVDCLVTDLVMPKMNGFELANRIRHSREVVNRRIPIVMVTGHANRENISRAINSGIDEVLVKPFRPNDLRKRLYAIAASPRRYIKTSNGYFGPDRRRSRDKAYFGPDRRLVEDVDTIDPQSGRRLEKSKLAARRKASAASAAKAAPAKAAPAEAAPVERNLPELGPRPKRSDVFTVRRDKPRPAKRPPAPAKPAKRTEPPRQSAENEDVWEL